MGQKTNPNILRLGITKNWKTEFVEKKKKELPLYIFKDLEIQSYVERFLERQKIFIHDYCQYYSNNTLNLYISYFVSSKSTFHIGAGKSQKVILIDQIGTRKLINCSKKRPLKFINTDFDIKNSKKMYEVRTYLKDNKFDNNLSNFITKSSTNSLKSMLKVISQFTLNKFDIKVNFSCVNKDFVHLSSFKTKKVRLLQKFKSAPFFKDGLELLFHVAYNKNSARLLAKFIAFQLKVVNRPNFFLSFIKNTLSILISSNLSILKGVKILLKGRLTKGPRAKHKILTIGDVAVQSLNSDMDYFQTTVHNSNGSYGIKVWIVCK